MPHATRPPELVPCLLPETLTFPSKQALKCYVGHLVCKPFGELDGVSDWYVGEVANISVASDGVALLKIHYEDNDKEDMDWEDFRQWAVVDQGGLYGGRLGRQEPDTPASQPHAPTSGGNGGGGGGGSTVAPRKRRASAAGLPAAQADPESPTPVRQRRGTGEPARAGPEDQERQEGQGARPAVRRRLNLEDCDGFQHHPHDHGASSAPATPAAAGAATATAATARHVPPPRVWRLPVGCDPCPAGHLHRISLVHFMCHEHLEVKFGRHVTFIGGQNGSGKSAVLQGLQACLGASARETSRGSSLASWVKTGRQRATVTLEVWNTGEQEEHGGRGQKWPPFRHDLYGPLIRVVRKIPATGGASYHLHRTDGSEVKPAEMGQSAAKEVAALAAHFNVDASNPLIIITQDMARQFYLESTQAAGRSGPRCSKYRMFMDGTCLSATRDQLAAAAENVALTSANMQNQRDKLLARREELAALDKQAEMLQQAEGLKRMLADVDLAAVWLVVAEAEAGLRAAKEGAAAAPRRVEQLTAALAAAVAAQAELQAQENSLREEMDDTRAQQLPARMTQLAQHKKDALQRRARAVRKLDQQTERMCSRQELHDARKADLAELSEAQQSNAALLAMQKHQERVLATNEELARLQAQASQLEARRVELVAQMAASDETTRTQRAAFDAAQTSLHEARAMRDELAAAPAAGNGANGDNNRVLILRWSSAAVRLMEAVRNARPGTFSAPPIGPVGRYLRRDGDCDPRFAAVLETALAPVMDRWLVARREDGDALGRLAQACGLGTWKPRVTVTPYKSQTHSYRVAPLGDVGGVAWRRVIDLVKLEEGLPPMVCATVINSLLDSADAACTVLVDDMSTGQSVAGGCLAQYGVYTAYDTKGAVYQDRNGTMLTNFKQLPTMPRLDAVAVDNRAQLAAQLAEAERLLAVRAAEAAEARAAHDAAEAALAQLRAEAAQVRTQQVALTRREALLKAQLVGLREETPAASSEAQSAALMNALAEAAGALEEAREARGAAESERNNAEKDVQETEAGLHALHSQSESYVARRTELMAQVNALAAHKGAAAAATATRQEELAAAQEAARAAQERIDKYEAEVEEAKAAAVQFCTREEGREALERVREAKRLQLERAAAAAAERGGAGGGRGRRGRLAEDWEVEREAELQKAMTYGALQSWAAKTTRHIASMEERGDLQAVSMKAEAARQTSQLEEGAFKAVLKKLGAMVDSQRLRDDKYLKIRADAEKITNLKFGGYMSRRNMTASLQLLHEPAGREKMVINVRPANQPAAASSLMQLSGGERSFTTVAFLLAVAEVLEAPFRCADEVDVFMDLPARKIAFAALVDYAWLVRPDCQLILFSPHDSAAAVEGGDALARKCQKDGVAAPPEGFVLVYKLADPRAGTQA